MEISRRQFLKALTAGALAINAGPFLSACGGVRRSDIMPAIETNVSMFGLDKRDEQILNLAALAPSVLNIQPWFVRVVDRRRWIIGADPSRKAPAIDPDNREIFLSIGAFVETLVLSAGALGLRADAEVIAQSFSDQDVVRIDFVHQPPLEYPLKRIELRRTVKKGLQNKSLELETESALSDPLKDHFFYFPRGSQHASCIQDGVVEHFRAALERDEVQTEIASWMRLSDKDAAKYLDGLTLESMEIGGIPGWYLRHFAEPPDFLKPRYRSRSLDYTANLSSEGAGWIVITSSDKSVSSAIETGRRFQRMALLARELKVGIHPMNQYLEEPSGMNQILSLHDSTLNPQFILRVGYLDSYPAPVSLRRPANWFVRT